MVKLFRDEIIRVLSTKIRFANVSSHLDNLSAYCPFHKDGQERTPSLYVYVGPSKGSRQRTGSAFCQACGTGWSFSGFLRKLGVNREYVDAVNELVEEEESHGRKKEYYDKISFELPKLPEAVLGKFEWAPRKLLESGFEKKVLKEFDIGYDKGAKRITFPLRDHHGNLVGISGRTIEKDTYPRYKIYRKEFNQVVSGYEVKKGRILWGLDRFYLTAMETGIKGPVVVHEGFKAAMWSVQCGFNNSVALIGDFCSEEQKLLLGRVTNEAVLFLDNDRAGVNATDRIIDFIGDMIDIKIANYPSWADGFSPDDLCKADVRKAIKTAITKTEWRTRNGR